MGVPLTLTSTGASSAGVSATAGWINSTDCAISRSRMTHQAKQSPARSTTGAHASRG